MSFFEIENSAQEPTAEENLLQLGMRADLLSQLSVDHARIALEGMYSILAKLMHPDTGELEEYGVIKGVGDLARIHARLRDLKDSELSTMLEAISETSIEASKDRARLQAEQQRDYVLGINKELANQLLDGYERAAPPVNARLFIHPPAVTGDVQKDMYDHIQEEGMSITITDGVVREAYLAQAKGSLVSSLSPEAQNKLTERRPHVDSPEELVFEDGSTPGLPEGWYRLVTAHSKTSSNKRLAVRYYSPSDENSYDLSELEGSTLVGYYAAPWGGSRGDLKLKVLPSDTTSQRSMIETTSLQTYTRVISRFLKSDVAYMISRGIITPPINPKSANVQPVFSSKHGSKYMILAESAYTELL